MKGKILEIDYSGSWTGKQYGEMHTYLVRIQGDDQTYFGEANAKSDNAEGLPYKIGDEVEFEHEPSTSPEYHDKLKIKKEGSKNYSGGNKSNKEDPNDKRRGVALSYAKDLVIAGKIPLENMYKNADESVKWLDS